MTVPLPPHDIPIIKPRPVEQPSVVEAPVVWVRDHTFWRDVATQALGTGLVALVAYVYAVATGYLTTPSGKAVLAFLFYGAGVLAFVGVAAYVNRDGSRMWWFVLLCVVCSLASTWLAPSAETLGSWKVPALIFVGVCLALAVFLLLRMIYLTWREWRE